MTRVLVLCEGNICRSPMAAALLAASAPHVDVDSAGLGAMVGWPADALALQLMGERNLDITSHRAKQVTRPMCRGSDVILVMESNQRKRLEDLYPEVRGRVFRIDEQDVPDPFRKSEQVFRHSLDRIARGVDAWTRKLKQLQSSS